MIELNIPALEEAVRALVPFSYGAFEDQRWIRDGHHEDVPAGTPKQHAYNAATAVIVAYLTALGEKNEADRNRKTEPKQLELF